MRLQGAGWREREALLEHAGTEVRLQRVGTARPVTLRVGDVVHLGGAKVSLVGLLPQVTAALPDAAALPAFGPYEVGADPTGDAAPEAAAALDLAPPPAPAAVRTAAATAALAGASSAPGEGGGKPPPLRRSAFAQRDFGEEIFAQLRRAPFFMGSVGIHLLVFLVLLLLARPVPRGAPEGDGELVASMDPPPAEVEAAAHEPPPAPEPLPELPAPEDFPEPGEPVDEDGEPVALPVLPDPDLLPEPVGLNPSLSAADARSGRRHAPPARVELSKSFQKDGAAAANSRAAEFVRAQLGLDRGGEGDPLRLLAPHDLLVVDGAFDHVDKVLEQLGLPFETTTPLKLAAAVGGDLSRHKVIFWNCGEGLPPRRLPAVARRIRAFVERGGYVFSTDWAVVNVISEAFPGTIDSGGRRQPLPETVVQIRPAEGQARHPLLAGVFPRDATGRWWLEEASFPIDVLAPDRVTVLVESPDLEQLFGRSTAVAVTFDHGRGRVLHVMGHYYQEAGNLAGAIAAQRLALNFVIDRLGAEDR